MCEVNPFEKENLTTKKETKKIKVRLGIKDYGGLVKNKVK